MATTFVEKQKKGLIKKFHVLLNQAKIDETGKRDILAAYGVRSTLDLSCAQLIEICNKITTVANPALAEADKWRKRVIKSIFAYCEVIGRDTDMAEVKRIACRAAGYNDFNRIPVARLSNLYNAFKNKVKDFEKVGSIAAEDLLNVIYKN
ncbi:hypothetical protein [Tannerella forsythia]|uniref:hypothetical protein n=1 Tax=Tannerella forsythia TaxID=28112 RepID=UPI00242CF163|nr:hypothetical protein [Tannerella forsythia]